MTSPNPEKDDAESPARNTVVYRTRITILLAVAGFAASVFAATPYGPVALVISAVLMLMAAVWSILTMVAMKKARLGWFGYVLMSLILAGALYFALNAGLNLVLWSVTEDYRECVRNSLTISSGDECQRGLLRSLMDGLSGKG